jgi:sarcosine oxidase subunit alpha
MRRTSVFGVYDGNTFGALERVADHLPVPPPHQPRQRLWKIVAKRTVLATGAIERPIVFGGNDRPGVMMASAVRIYLNRFAVTPGKRVAVFSATDDGWSTALDLAAAGISVEAIIDPRAEVSPALEQRARKAGIPVVLESEVIEARGARGLRAIEVRNRHTTSWTMSVDALAISGGWTPNLGLTTHLGGRPRWSQELSSFVPAGVPPGMSVVGAANGDFGLGKAVREGSTAGRAAAESTGHRAPPAEPFAITDEPVAAAPFWYVSAETAKAFVDFQNDVTRDDIALAAREGYRSVELLKRYTTLGMATDQGKTSNLNGAAVLAAHTDRTLPQLGTTVFRPPGIPVALGALAGAHRGKHFRPIRLTAAHTWAAERGATFVEAGQWLRAQWFAAPGEHDWLDTVIREVKSVRSSVGVCDVSTLGKIDVQGTDAGAFLDRLYINSFSRLPVGRVRYGLMLREDGFALDDGTCAHLSPGHYLMSTTTANAAKVMQHLEHARQVLWPELDVQIVSVTEQWAQYAIAGPSSRVVLQELLGDAIDLSNGAFPHMACAQFLWRGIGARLFRISFSGELAYELAVPARFGEATLCALMHAGARWGLTPYGTEALGVMRVEKGHVGGNELNGTTTAADLGLGRMMSTQKDFIGRVLAARTGLADPSRPSLVGVKPIDRSPRLYSGAHLLARGAVASLANDAGYLTSVAFSPMLGHWIGLGLLTRGRERHGEKIRVYDPLHDSDLEAEVASPVFFDPEGSRLQKEVR